MKVKVPESGMAFDREHASLLSKGLQVMRDADMDASEQLAVAFTVTHLLNKNITGKMLPEDAAFAKLWGTLDESLCNMRKAMPEHHISRAAWQGSILVHAQLTFMELALHGFDKGE